MFGHLRICFFEIGGWLGVALAIFYVLSPIDLIPDPIPVVGWIDDCAAIIGGIAATRTALSARSARKRGSNQGAVTSNWRSIMGFFNRLATGYGSSTQLDRWLEELGWGGRREGEHLCVPFKRGNDERDVIITGDGSKILTGFACISQASLPVERVPTDVFGYLLDRNSEMAFGAWQVLELQGRQCSFGVTYSGLHAGITSAVFEEICKSMANEVGDFDAKMRQCGLLR